MLNLAILFGGASNEHDISLKSTKSILDNIDKTKYNISLYYLDKKNNIFKTDSISNNNLIESSFYDLKKYDLVFPIMHGSFVEDGKLQGLFDILNITYVGCNTLTSSICMDKVMTKKILDSENIPNTPYIYIYKDYDLNKLKQDIIDKIGYPCIIKPSSSGSSFGVSKCLYEDMLEKSLNEAFLYDNKVLIEKYINGKELEVALLGNDNILISSVGEIISSDTFYTYDAKYNKESITKISDIDSIIKDKIKEYALSAYKLLECKTLSRIDFLLDSNNNIYLNEINTMPGFTSISMYPFLMNDIGISYSTLIDKIIDLSLNKN